MMMGKKRKLFRTINSVFYKIKKEKKRKKKPGKNKNKEEVMRRNIYIYIL